MRTLNRLTALLSVGALGVGLSAGQPSLLRGSIDNSDRVLVRGNVPAALATAPMLGHADRQMPMQKMLLSLNLSAEAHARLEQLLAEQQERGSANYHKWLTPAQFGENFGASKEDLKAVTDWLESQGFAVDQVSPSRTSITFSGDVQRVERAFRTSIQRFQVEGQERYANAGEISLPRALAGLVNGVVSLNNLPRHAMNTGLRKLGADEIRRLNGQRSNPDFNYGTSHYLAPGDFATIYNVKALYTGGYDGTGVSIAVVGRTEILQDDITAFRSQFGLPANPFTLVVNGPDPGFSSPGDEGESDLDVEWAGAVAKGANIKFVVSQSFTSDGIDLSAQYIVDNNLAPIMTTSYGSCEAGMGTAENNFYATLWAQAAAQGISSFVSTGDSGAAGCQTGGSSSGSGVAVSGLASTPYNIAVGGTEFMDSTGSYWAASNNTDGSSALGYIPEAVWNESGTVSGGDHLWSGSGGVSSIYAKPSWQVAAGVPADGKRDIPDVSLTAAGHDGYLIIQEGGLGAVGGTSASTPSFAGLMALIVQKTGQRQGNANPVLYKLGQAQYSNSSAPKVFHDVTVGDNSVPGTTGYSAGTGYDLATGLGTVDAKLMADNWTLPTNTVTASITAPAADGNANNHVSVDFTATATDSGAGTTLTYIWNFGDGSTPVQGSTATHSFENSTATDKVFPVTLTVTDNTGASVTKVRNITVPPNPVHVVITAPMNETGSAPGVAVTFSAVGSTTNPGATLTYTWAFFDGGGFVNGATVQHTFPAGSNAFYPVTLTLTDSTGAITSTGLTFFSGSSMLDVDGNGAQDVRDLLFLGASWGTSIGSPDYLWYTDMNADGTVNDTDLTIWLSAF